MSDDLPFEIQMEIIQKIADVKLLIQLRSVSKAWKSAIDSKEFINGHTLCHTHPHHLLIRGRDMDDSQVKYVSVLDDDVGFPHQKFSMIVPDSVNMLNDSIIAGSSHGLFCFHGFTSILTMMAVIWNPCIRKSVAIALPEGFNSVHYRTVVCFGVCPRTLDPKLVKITCIHNRRIQLEDIMSDIPRKVEVFTLSSGDWRSPLGCNLPRKSIGIGWCHVVIDSLIYLDAFDRITPHDRFTHRNLIISFDMSSEEFTEVGLPENLALRRDVDLSLSKLRESLIILECNFYAERKLCALWVMMEQGCTRSFKKLYTIKPRDATIHTTLGFRKSGTPIIEVQNDNEDFFTSNALAVYEPESQDISKIGIYGIEGAFFVHSYMETLLLLGHSDYST